MLHYVYHTEIIASTIRDTFALKPFCFVCVFTISCSANFKEVLESFCLIELCQPLQSSVVCYFVYFLQVVKKQKAR